VKNRILFGYFEIPGFWPLALT